MGGVGFLAAIHCTFVSDLLIESGTGRTERFPPHLQDGLAYTQSLIEQNLVDGLRLFETVFSQIVLLQRDFVEVPLHCQLAVGVHGGIGARRENHLPGPVDYANYVQPHSIFDGVQPSRRQYG